MVSVGICTWMGLECVRTIVEMPPMERREATRIGLVQQRGLERNVGDNRRKMEIRDIGRSVGVSRDTTTKALWSGIRQPKWNQSTQKTHQDIPGFQGNLAGDPHAVDKGPKGRF